MRQIGMEVFAKDYSDRAHFRRLKELGFDTVFSATPPREMAARNVEAAAAEGLVYETLHAPFHALDPQKKHNINDIWLDTPEGEAMRLDLVAAVDRCAENSIPVVVIHLSSGNNPPDLTDIGRGRYEDLVDYAIGKGVKVAFENIRKLHNVAWAMEAFRNVPEVGMCWDCGHEACYTPGIRFMPLFGKRLFCTHIHDNDCGVEHDQHVLPFDGNIDFTRVANELRESGYTGSLMLENCVKNANWYGDIDYDTYLQRAAKAAKKLRKMVDGE